jgi:hypothetical protein
MNRNKKCYLHIGAPKTGSTALQYFLYENRRKLAEHGWIYPDVSLRGFGHHDIALLLDGGYPEWALPQERSLSELIEELRKSIADCSQVILSSENFYLFPHPQQVAEIMHSAGFPPESIRIVAYIRRQDEAHISWYNQTVKAQGYPGTIDQCIQETFELWDYQTQLEKWAHVFGQKNILIRPYEKKQLVDGDVRKDFLKLLHISTDDLIFAKKTINTRLNRDLLEFQRILNHLPLSSKEKRSFHKEMIDLTLYSDGKNVFDDSPLLAFEQRKNILSSYESSNNYVSQTYLKRKKLFDNELSCSDQQSNTHNTLSIDKVIQIFGWIMIKKNQNISLQE